MCCSVVPNFNGEFLYKYTSIWLLLFLCIVFLLPNSCDRRKTLWVLCMWLLLCRLIDWLIVYCIMVLNWCALPGYKYLNFTHSFDAWVCVCVCLWVSMSVHECECLWVWVSVSVCVWKTAQVAGGEDGRMGERAGCLTTDVFSTEKRWTKSENKMKARRLLHICGCECNSRFIMFWVRVTNFS